MKRITLQAHNLQTLSWLGDKLIDWADSGKQYQLNGEIQHLNNYGFGDLFDSAITSDDGIYAVIYQNLGTKGLLLKNGKIIRELNRSYYCADVYEYPIAFFRSKNGTNYLVHCLEEYCRIEFEEVEKGKRVRGRKKRRPEDFFIQDLNLVRIIRNL